MSKITVAILVVLCGIGVEGGVRQRPVRVVPRTVPVVDCTAPGPCPEVVIQGDAPATLGGRPSPARGFADPSIRRDPVLGVLWMAYSWPHIESLYDRSVAVDSHLARSDDRGATWRFIRALWTSNRTTDEDGAAGHLNSEVVSLAAGDDLWYSVRLVYFTAGSPKLTSFTLHVAAAVSPAALVTANESILGGSRTHSFWRPDANLASLSPELNGCTWNDPALHFSGGTLYLVTQCLQFVGGEESPEREFIAVFSTRPQGPPRQWSWNYLGKLAGSAEAQELGGAMLQQTDLAIGRDGKLLAIFSPSFPSAPLSTHLGCRVLEVASLNPPRLARRAGGSLRIRGAVLVSDQPPLGPGSCGYDAASVTGVVIARRQVHPELISSLHASGIRP